MTFEHKKLLDAHIIQQDYGINPDTNCKFDAYNAVAGEPNWTSNFTNLKDHSTIWIKYDPDQFDYT